MLSLSLGKRDGVSASVGLSSGCLSGLLSLDSRVGLHVVGGLSRDLLGGNDEQRMRIKGIGARGGSFILPGSVRRLVNVTSKVRSTRSRHLGCLLGG